MGATVADAVLEVLTPLVGAPAANICVHSIAGSAGKSSDALTSADLPAVAEKIRSDMRAFASPEVLDQAIADIKARVG